jgi:hypothetical protein
MKLKLAVAALIMALSAMSAMATKNATATGCTQDSHSATVAINYADSVTDKIQAEVQKAFADTAASMTAERLRTREGYDSFISKLSEEDKSAIEGFDGLSFGDSCK